MVTPVGKPGKRISEATIAYVTGAVFGGMAVGLCLGLLSTVGKGIPPIGQIVALIVISCWALSADLYGLPVPEARRQVPESVMFGSRVRGAARFGFEMGLGCRTYMPIAAPVAAAALLTIFGAGIPTCLLAGAAFGGARGALHIAKWRSRMTSWSSGLESLAESRFFVIGSSTTTVVAASVAILGQYVA